MAAGLVAAAAAARVQYDRGGGRLRGHPAAGRLLISACESCLLRSPRTGRERRGPSRTVFRPGPTACSTSWLSLSLFPALDVCLLLLSWDLGEGEEGGEVEVDLRRRQRTTRRGNSFAKRSS